MCARVWSWYGTWSGLDVWQYGIRTVGQTSAFLHGYVLAFVVVLATKQHAQNLLHQRFTTQRIRRPMHALLSRDEGPSMFLAQLGFFGRRLDTDSA